jgi:hypothetical protein
LAAAGEHGRPERQEGQELRDGSSPPNAATWAGMGTAAATVIHPDQRASARRRRTSQPQASSATAPSTPVPVVNSAPPQSFIGPYHDGTATRAGPVARS